MIRILAFLIVVGVSVVPAFSASRFWVGGGSSTNWNATGNTNWSASSGGANNASVPTVSDDAIFDGNSGSGTANVSAGITIGTLTTTGYTGTIAIASGIALDVKTNVLIGSGTLFTAGSTASSITWNQASVTATLTTNGVSMPHLIVSTSGGTVTLQDTLNILSGNSLTVTQGTLNTNGQTVNLTGGTAGFVFSGASTRTLTLGASTINIGSNQGTLWSVAGSGFTLSAASSTINITGAHNGASRTFAGGGQTYGALSLTGGGTSQVIITGANTFSTLTLGAGESVAFPASTTTTVTTLVANGTGQPNNIITVASTTPGTQATISQASGTVNANVLNLSDSAATGGATFNCIGCANMNDNTGWNFIELYTQIGAFLVGIN